MKLLNCLALFTLVVGTMFCSPSDTYAQSTSSSKKTKELRTFRWVNRQPESKTRLLKHGTFESRANQATVGYYIYLPPEYDERASAAKRFPVVYYLHGGRPGGEHLSIKLAGVFDEAIRSKRIPAMIYVFVNGGEVSHYDYPEKKSYGETAFVDELIPNIDSTFRTIAKREGRGLEGFSQGGRGTARIMFKHPELFCSAAPMGGGHAHEKHISEHGKESGGMKFDPKNNTYDLALSYKAEKMSDFPLQILVALGKRDFNYEANLDWMEHLKQTGIPFQYLPAGDAPHSADQCYKILGDQVMLFHAKNFGLLDVE